MHLGIALGQRNLECSGYFEVFNNNNQHLFSAGRDKLHKKPLWHQVQRFLNKHKEKPMSNCIPVIIIAHMGTEF